MRPALLLFLSLTFAGLLGFQVAGAQTPPSPAATATPPVLPPPPVVGPPGSPICTAQYSGGQTISPILPVRATFQITLPPGGSYGVSGGIADPGGEFVRVCYVEGNSAIFFNLEGRETSRAVNNPSANAVLDEIARGIKVGPSSLPTQSAAPLNICGTAARPAPAGESIRLNTRQGTVAITLPSTGSYQFSIPGEFPGSANGISICDTATGSTIVISAETGRDAGRNVSGPAGAAALDRILAGVQFLRAGAPPPQLVTPPVTGEAGLLPAHAATD